MYKYFGINMLTNVLLQSQVLQYLYKVYNASEAVELLVLETMGIDCDLDYAVQQFLAICVLETLVLDMRLVLGIDFGDLRKTRTRVELGANGAFQNHDYLGYYLQGCPVSQNL